MTLRITASGLALFAGGSTLSSTTDSGATIGVSATFTETGTDGNPISPGAVWLDVSSWTGWSTSGPTGTSKYDPRLHDIEYYWTITGPAGASFAAHANINLPTSPAAFRDLSIQRGPRVCFPLVDSDGREVVGTWTWTCFAVEVSSGKTHTASGSFTTVGADAEFPTTQTICFSSGNDFTGAPTGSTNVTTLAALTTARDAAITAGDPFRILLRSGETLTDMDVGSGLPTTYPNWRLGTFGAGGAVTINGDSITYGGLFTAPASAGAKNVWISGNIVWDAGWDATTETGYAQGVAFDPRELEGVGGVWGVEVKGANRLLNAPQKNHDSRWAFINVYAHNYRNWGMFIDLQTNENTHLALIGTTIACPTGCVDGVYGRNGSNEYIIDLCNGAGNAGWVMRIQSVFSVIMQHCDFHSAMGYTAGGNHQTPVRVNTSGMKGAIYNIAYTSIEGGAYQIDNLNSSVNDPTLLKEMNLIVDACILVPTGVSGAGMRIRATGVTVRNTFFRMSDYVIWSGASGQSMFSINEASFGSFPADTQAAPVKLYNNTMQRGRDPDNFSNVINTYSSMNVTEENNILAWVGRLDEATAMAGYSRRWQGRKQGFPIETVVLGADVTDGNTFTMPYPTGTDQAYWTALSDTFHVIVTSGGSILYADGPGGTSDFSVAFGASEITVTNNWGSTIGAGTIRVKLDRASQLVQTNTHSTTDGLTWTKIDAGNAVSLELSTGLKSDRDITDTRRGDTDYQGMWEYA